MSQYAKPVSAPYQKFDKLCHTEYCMTSSSIPSFDVRPQHLTADNTFHSAAAVPGRTWLGVESVQRVQHRERTSPANHKHTRWCYITQCSWLGLSEFCTKKL